MSDTRRTQAELLDIFADTPVIQGRMTPQNMRDLIVSIGTLSGGVASITEKRFAGGAKTGGVIDCTDAILAATLEPEGTTIIAPPGLYKFSDNIPITLGQYWLAARANRHESETVANVAPYGGGAIFQKSGDFTGITVLAQETVIEGLTVRGQYNYAAAAPVGVGSGIKVSAKYVRVIRASAPFNGLYGFLVTDGDDNVHFGEFDILTEYNASHGVAVVSTADPGFTNKNKYTGRSGRNRGDGYNIGAGNYADYHIEASYNLGWGVRFTAGQWSELDGHTEGNMAYTGVVGDGETTFTGVSIEAANIFVQPGYWSDGITESNTVDEQSIQIRDRIYVRKRLTRTNLGKLHFIAEVPGAVGRIAGHGNRHIIAGEDYNGGIAQEQLANTKFQMIGLVPTVASPDGVDVLRAIPAPPSNETGFGIISNRGAGGTAVSTLKIGAVNSNADGTKREITIANWGPLEYTPGASLVDTFTRSTTANQLAQTTGTAVSKAINTFRDGHYIGAVRTLLMEPGRTNSILWSRDLTNAAWVKTGTNTSAQTLTGLDGSANSGTTIGDTAAGTLTNFAQAVTVPADSATHAAGFWVLKDADVTRFPGLKLGITGGTTVRRTVNLNTQTGAFVTTANAGTGTSAVYDAGNWWLVVVTLTNNSTASNTTLTATIFPASQTVIGTDNAAATGTIGIGNVDVDLNSTYIASPIFTTTVAVTQGADAETITAVTSGIPATLYTRYLDIAAANAVVDAVASYTTASSIALSTGRAYTHVYVFDGDYTLAQARTALGT